MTGRPSKSLIVMARNIVSSEPRISRAWCSNSRPVMPYKNSRIAASARNVRTDVRDFYHPDPGKSIMHGQGTPMFADQGRVIFTLLVLLFLGWFALGTQLNIRRGNAVLTWLQNGLKLLGSRTTLRWLGSSGVELKVQEPIAPFRWAQVFVVLEPRDVPFLWWLSRRRGRRELLILRGHLQSMPTFELEALDAGSWSTRHVERDVRE